MSNKIWIGLVWLSLATIPYGLTAQEEVLLRRSGKQIVDGNGQEVLLRGIGLGGWMLQEGYMLETAGFAGTQHEIRDLITRLIGAEGTQGFYEAWLANHVTKKDIDSLARWGFNSVRPALHYNLFTLPIEEEPLGGYQTWIDKGFIMLDSLVSWCAANRMYVILDLHAAPGGQGRDNNISDRDPSRLSLWESSANRTKTVELWKKLAERYAGNPWIGGYDILNETNWDFEQSGNQNGCNCQQNKPLADLFKKIIGAIRSRDQQHIIFLEGNCWGGNFNGLESLFGFDDNLVLSFHRYWSQNTYSTIADKVRLRDTYNLPLWMGESGENSNHWFTEAVSLLEKNDIGWSWWPEKKIHSVVGPMTVVKTPEYQRLLDYWEGRGPAPDPVTAEATLMQMAENLKIQNCEIHYDVMDALLRQPHDSTLSPFMRHALPGTIPAVHFDLGKNGIAYQDKEYENNGNSSHNWNLGWIYRNDGPDIVYCQDSAEYSNGYAITGIEKGEWLKYSIDIDTAGYYDLMVRTSSTLDRGAFRIEINGMDVSGTLAVPITGDLQKFYPVMIRNIRLEQGIQCLAIVFEEGGFNLSSFVFNGPTGVKDVAFSLMSVKTDELGRQLILTFNQELTGYPATGISFYLVRGEETVSPGSVIFNRGLPRSLFLKFSTCFAQTDHLLLTYQGDQIIGQDAEVLAAFSNRPVVNIVTMRHLVPGHIEAEDFFANHGFQFEECSDTGNGLNAGWADPGDYLDFPVRIVQAGRFEVTCRYSCYSGTSQAELLLSEDSLETLGLILFPSTGGWQQWQSAKQEVILPAGWNILRFQAITAGFNLNHFDLVKVTDSIKPDTASQVSFKLFPNPASHRVHVEITNPEEKSEVLEVIDPVGHILHTENTPPLKQILCILDTRKYRAGLYFVRIRDEQIMETQSLFIVNL